MRPLGFSAALGRWRPALAAAWIAACLGTMAATVGLMKGALHNAFILRSADISQKAHGGLQELLDRHARDWGDLARHLGETPALEEEDFRERAVRVLRQGPAFAAVHFFNDNFILQWGFPSNWTARGLDLRTRLDALGAARRSIERRGPAATGGVDLLEGGRGVLLYAPVFRESNWSGLAEGVLRLTNLAREGIAPLVGPRFRFAIVDDRRGEEIHSTLTEADRGQTPAYDACFTLSLADRTWWIILHPAAPPGGG